ncbi:S-adenosyl-L-methionine-dependent methyltransferase [Amylocystis lapponica]|nr:S-adenosyl-L-methionine-dependent methyltransferase [Amylocystis lapponica]
MSEETLYTSTVPGSLSNAGLPFVRQLVADYQSEGWVKAWQAKVTPWDAGHAQPPLRVLLESERLPLPKSGRALVPGCGRGYDAILIASALGLNTLGVDISSIAVAGANELVASSPAAPIGKVTFEVRDFFALGTSVEEQFDLVYDYTFFVALPPSQRGEWGRKMSAVIKPGGYLITLVFPLDSPKDLGPPWYVEVGHYAEVLGDGWERVLDEIPTVISESHKGQDRLVVWKRL